MLFWLMAAMQPQQADVLPAADGRHIKVYVRMFDRKCIYWPTDTGHSAAQLIDYLDDRDDQEKREIDILFIAEQGVPDVCVAAGKKAARAAGFVTVSHRLRLDTDRGPAEPPDSSIPELPL
jgi:hypothetical protein